MQEADNRLVRRALAGLIALTFLWCATRCSALDASGAGADDEGGRLYIYAPAPEASWGARLDRQCCRGKKHEDGSGSTGRSSDEAGKPGDGDEAGPGSARPRWADGRFGRSDFSDSDFGRTTFRDFLPGHDDRQRLPQALDDKGDDRRESLWRDASKMRAYDRRDEKYLISPVRNLLLDWVPDKMDPLQNGGFSTSPDNGAPVPYRLNGHVDMERGRPWDAGN